MFLIRGGGGGGGGAPPPPALVLSLVTLHNVWKSWHYRFLMEIKHGYLTVNDMSGTTFLDPPFTLFYRTSRGVMGRMLEFREWACTWEGYSFLWVKSNSDLFVFPSSRVCESLKGYVTRSPFPGLASFSTKLDIEILVTDCHTSFYVSYKIWFYKKKICPAWSLSFSSLSYPLRNTIRPFKRGK